MTLVRLIFLLFAKFIPVSEQERSALNNEAELWFDKCKEESGLRKWIYDISCLWYVKVLFGILYILFIRWIYDFMNPREDIGDKFTKYD